MGLIGADCSSYISGWEAAVTCGPEEITSDINQQGNKADIGVCIDDYATVRLVL